MTETGPALHWLIDDIGTLDAYSFRASLDVSLSSFTLTVWMRAERSGGRQVVARLNAAELLGWSLVFDGARLSAEYGTAEHRIVSVDGPPVELYRWTFAAFAFDAEAHTLSVSDGRTSASVKLEPPQSAPREIVVGGYTDPAGGHYDHTFGRGGSGLVDDVRLYGRILTDAELSLQAEVSGGAPAAQIGVTAAGDAPCTVRFDAVGTAGERSVVWDFGDGSSAVGHTADHRYEYAGTYTVRLTAISSGHRQTTVETVLTLGGTADPLRRVPVFVNGTEGHACYRIPSIVRAANGDLLAFAEGRRDSCSDSTPVIRIVSKRSADNGRTWKPLNIVARHTHTGGEYALMNASPVVDTARGTGRIVLLYNVMTHNEWDLARGEGQNHTFCVTSDDHGETWNAPYEISSQIGDTLDWRIQRPTLGHAIQRDDGRIIHSSTITAGDASVFHSQNVLIWSDDLGQTWHHGEPCSTIGLNESTAAVMEDGGVLLNNRAYIEGNPAGRRALTYASFGPGDRVRYEATTYHPDLIDPAVQGSMLRLTFRHQREYGGQSRILFCNPAHPNARLQLTIRLSSDEGRTWPHRRVIDTGPSAYSDLVWQADGRIGVLYERGNQGGIAYANFTLDWFTRGADRLGALTESGGPS